MTFEELRDLISLELASKTVFELAELFMDCDKCPTDVDKCFRDFTDCSEMLENYFTQTGELETTDLKYITLVI